MRDAVREMEKGIKAGVKARQGRGFMWLMVPVERRTKKGVWTSHQVSPSFLPLPFYIIPFQLLLEGSHSTLPPQEDSLFIQRDILLAFQRKPSMATNRYSSLVAASQQSSAE